MSKPMSVQEFFKEFPNDDTCLEHLFRVRFGEQMVCPKCTRTNKFHRLKSEMAYSCQWCGHHVHPMVGTPFEKSHTSLQRWYYAMYLFTTTRHGVSAKELQRQFGCSYKTAWRMGHEIRKYMGALDKQGPLDGNVEADETFIGGHRPNTEGRHGKSEKTIVFAMLDRETGEVISQVVPNTTGLTLRAQVRKHVKKGSTIHTDEYASYRKLAKQGYVHSAVNHSAGEYARDGSHVNTLEAYFSILKRSIRSTHIWVSEKHMPKYLAEFEYRMNLRRVPDLMFRLMLSFRGLGRPASSHP